MLLRSELAEVAVRVDIKIPSAGESVTEIRLARWIKSNGDFVNADEPILELETDKANMELTAETAGVGVAV